jgi:hypothetical protein
VKGFFRKGSAGERPGPADPADPEIVVRGYHLTVLWWQDRIVVQHNKIWHIYLEVSPVACHRADYSSKVYPDGHAETLLSLTLRVGFPDMPGELEGSIEIAFPTTHEDAVRQLVVKTNAEISSRAEAAGRPAAVPPVPHVQPIEPPVYPRPEPARPAMKTAEPIDLLRSTAITLAEAKYAPVDEAPRPVPVVEPPPRNEPPRLRQLDFVQAPDDADWISFCPLRTADEVRAVLPAGEYG